MNVVVFADEKPVRSAFEKVENSNSYTVEFFPVSELRARVKKIPPRSAVYVDLGPMEDAEQKKLVAYMEKQINLIVGFIDSKDSVADIGWLFHRGGADYIGKNLLKNRIETRRLKSAIEFGAKTLPGIVEKPPAAAQDHLIPSGSDWKDTKPGKEYTFCFMYIEMDNQKDLKSRFGAENLENVIAAFQEIIEEVVLKVGGRIWMWMDFGGLILIPFDGGKCDAVLTCFELVMDRSIINAEEFDLNLDLSFRIALHIGNTIYKPRGSTGEIVSDSVNSIFHLGQKYAQPGNFYLTDVVKPFIPGGLKSSFITDGTYEGREITRMRKLIS